MGQELVGYVTAYLCPKDPSTLMIWQVCVSPAARRQHVATAMINELVQSNPGVLFLEATITDNNLASRRLFLALGVHWRAPVQVEVLFFASEFPVPHQTERLYRIGPIGRSGQKR